LYQNIEKRRNERSGKKAKLEIMSASFLLQSNFCFAVRAVAEIYYETNRILAQKKRRVGALAIKKIRANSNRIAIFLRCQVSRN